jgi:hypothetical protein
MSEAGARAADDATPGDHGDDASAEPVDDAHEGPASASASASASGPGDRPSGVDDGPEPSWWHRSHPTFAGLVGFFAGVMYVIAVPGAYAALLGLLVKDSTTQQQLFPLVLLALLIPVAMLVPRKTRRFAMFMFLGIFSTALVIALTAALTIWVMVQIDG